MPIMMSVREFQKDTRMRFEKRPKALRDVDLALEEYHSAVRLRSPAKEGRQVNCLEIIIAQIEIWSRGLQRSGAAAHAPYIHVRDQYGKIAWLEYKARQELPAAERRLTAAMRGDGDVPPAQANIPAPPPIGGQAQPVANAPLPNGFLGAQAYDAAAHFLQSGWSEPVQKQDIINAASAANPAAASPMRVTFPALVQGIMQMGYLRLYSGQHCSMEVVTDTLLGATPLKPIMVVVGGNAPPFSAIVVTGRRNVMLGEHPSVQFTASDGIHAHDKIAFSSTGNYALQDQYGRITTAQLMPRLGFLKIMA